MKKTVKIPDDGSDVREGEIGGNDNLSLGNDSQGRGTMNYKDVSSYKEIPKRTPGAFSSVRTDARSCVGAKQYSAQLNSLISLPYL